MEPSSKQQLCREAEGGMGELIGESKSVTERWKERERERQRERGRNGKERYSEKVRERQRISER
jgi:hypothetical protein